MRVGAEGAGEGGDELAEDGDGEGADELHEEGVKFGDFDEGGDGGWAAGDVGEEVQEAVSEGYGVGWAKRGGRGSGGEVAGGLEALVASSGGDATCAGSASAALLCRRTEISWRVVGFFFGIGFVLGGHVIAVDFCFNV